MSMVPDLADAFAACIEAGGHVLQTLSLREVSSSDHELVLDLDNEPHVMNHRGALHGGIVATLVDTVAGRLATAIVPEGCSVVTADMNLRFLAPVLVGPARATATVVRLGRRTVVLSVEIVDLHTDRLAVLATAGFAVQEPLTSR